MPRPVKNDAEMFKPFFIGRVLPVVRDVFPRKKIRRHFTLCDFLVVDEDSRLAKPDGKSKLKEHIGVAASNVGHDYTRLLDRLADLADEIAGIRPSVSPKYMLLCNATFAREPFDQGITGVLTCRRVLEWDSEEYIKPALIDLAAHLARASSGLGTG